MAESFVAIASGNIDSGRKDKSTEGISWTLMNQVCTQYIAHLLQTEVSNEIGLATAMQTAVREYSGSRSRGPQTGHADADKQHGAAAA
jgi:hypothetical protein